MRQNASAYEKRLSLSHIQQICSRRFWKHLDKTMEILWKWKYNYWKELKTLWQKNKILVLINFSFCHTIFSKVVCCRRVRKRLHMIKRLYKPEFHETRGSSHVFHYLQTLTLHRSFPAVEQLCLMNYIYQRVKYRLHRGFFSECFVPHYTNFTCFTLIVARILCIC